MSWNVEFLEARRRLIGSDDYQRQRNLGHELSDGSMDTALGSDVPSRVRFQCQFCGSVISFGNSNWDSGSPAAWHLLPGDPADESCETRRDRRPRHRAVRLT